MRAEERRAESRRGDSFCAGMERRCEMRIPACVDWLFADWDDKKWYVKLAEVVSMAVAIYEGIFIAGMVSCTVEELQRKKQFAETCHEYLGGSANVRLWRESTQDMLSGCPSLFKDVKPVNDALVATVRSHTPGWFRLMIVKNEGEGHPLLVSCFASKSFEKGPVYTPNNMSYFELQFAVKQDGSMMPLCIMETMNSEYIFPHPDKFKEEKLVCISDKKPFCVGVKNNKGSGK